MLNRNDFLSQVKTAVSTINTSTISAPLLEYVCNETIDRVSFYLNVTEYDERLVKITARIANGVLIQTNTNLSGTIEQDVKSMSDNGQSITFGDSAKNYLNTVSDNELFSGFSELLKPYRRINVVFPKCNE